MKVTVKNIISSNLAISHEDGVALYKAIALIKPSDLILSFVGIDRMSSLFLHASIGKYVQQYGTFDIKKLIIPSEKPLFQYKIDDVVENSLLGEEYDLLIDNALAAM